MKLTTPSLNQTYAMIMEEERNRSTSDIGKNVLGEGHAITYFWSARGVGPSRGATPNRVH